MLLFKNSLNEMAFVLSPVGCYHNKGLIFLCLLTFMITILQIIGNIGILAH